ncbi:prenyltransferase [Ornithinimicrobium humiphilum]|uniref:4-hydroxybenzoate polyprenyltransferase n=1 Tax=Ornithinimicrobium humiphilum TaxID=125288 RepID=A0A543KJP8_9MICO|nr:prenyltransferase [Ornithinimicrobium humiphilum]TQM95303.1 4-hydroxybenzoate polyprenyltransferase [Ornithinimicrobium humiphilum]
MTTTGQTPTAPAPAAPGALRQLVGSSRPLSWVNTAYPFAAAYLLAGGGITLTLVLGTLWFLIPYNLLMYGVNDVFDYESDLRNPRKGGVEGVVLSRRWHRLTLWAAALTNLPFVVALVLLGDVFSTVVLAISVFAVIAYSAPGLRFKERPVLDSVTSSTHFVSPAVFALAIADAELTTPVLLALAAFFVWGMASQAFGAVQDIIADREGGISSIATVLGAATTVRAAFVAYLVAGVLLLPVGWPGALAALLVIPYAASVAPFLSLSDADCERANAGWRRFLWLNLVTGFLVTQLFIWMTLAS